MDYTMDEVAAFNEECDEESSHIMQGTRVTADYETRRHLMMAIKLVYRIQADEENWMRWLEMMKYNYHEVSAKSFYNIVERMAKNLDLHCIEHFAWLTLKSLNILIQLKNGSVYFVI